MGVKTFLELSGLLCLLALPELPAAQAQAQCEFSDGSAIVVSLPEHNVYELTTDEDLVTVRGTVPAGAYVVAPRRDAESDWVLMMTRPGDQRPSFTLPMRANTFPAAEKQQVSFEQTGGSCTMRWRWENGLLLLLEFTRSNSDVPLQSIH